MVDFYLTSAFVAELLAAYTIIGLLDRSIFLSPLPLRIDIIRPSSSSSIVLQALFRPHTSHHRSSACSRRPQSLPNRSAAKKVKLYGYRVQNRLQVALRAVEGGHEHTGGKCRTRAQDRKSAGHL